MPGCKITFGARKRKMKGKKLMVCKLISLFLNSGNLQKLVQYYFVAETLELCLNHIRICGTKLDDIFISMALLFGCA